MKYISTLGWGGATLVAIVLLGANAFWIAFASRSGLLGLQWLCVLLSLVIVCAIIGTLANGRLFGIFIDERNRISLSRFQWVLWFLVLFSSYFTGSVWDIAHEGGDMPAIDPNLFGLIGISSGSAVVSNLIVDTKKNEAPAKAPAPSDQPLVGKIDVNLAPNDASWADLYLGEEEGNRNSIDASRLQKLIATILLVIVYSRLVWHGLSPDTIEGGGSFTMPVIGTSFLTLMGASHAAYLAYKGTTKTPNDRSATTPPAAPAN
jgi:hypothetical protein